MFSSKKNQGKVSAIISDASDNKVYEVFGKWTESLFYKKYKDKDKDGIKIWEFPEIPKDWEKIYHFTDFTLQLNLLQRKLEDKLPPTDSRFRPDQRMLEEGELKQANAEKQRLEEKQRRRRKRMEAANVKYKPRYFYEYEEPDPTEAEKG